MANEENTNPVANGNGSADAGGPQLTVQKVYIRDSSFEAPGAPHIFQEQGQSRVELNLGQKAQQLAPNVYEIVLTITVTCKMGEKTAYLAEVQQAGIFGLSGFDPQQLDMVIGTYCPHVLFPYARQTISTMVEQGGFPAFLMQPINFEQIYSDNLKRRQAQAA
ncbi:MAG TPA: protein-export chaperone SecB [Xanthomonadales bacterium]|nr:protein-export chaperone SecB [Xanthomonadales bacterium]